MPIHTGVGYTNIGVQVKDTAIQVTRKRGTRKKHMRTGKWGNWRQIWSGRFSETETSAFGIGQADTEVRNSETSPLAWGLDLCQAPLQSQTLSSTPWHPHWKRNMIQEEASGISLADKCTPRPISFQPLKGLISKRLNLSCGAVQAISSVTEGYHPVLL